MIRNIWRWYQRREPQRSCQVVSLARAVRGGVGQAIGVGSQDERAHHGQAHGLEAALGLGVEGAGGAVREGQRLLQRGEVAGVGGGDVVGSAETQARMAAAAACPLTMAEWMPSPVSGSTRPAASPTSSTRPRGT